MIKLKRTKPMTLEVAIAITKWGVYVTPTPTNAEEKEAFDMVKANPQSWKDLRWSK